MGCLREAIRRMGFNMARTCRPWRCVVSMGFQAGSCDSTCVRGLLSAHVQCTLWGMGQIAFIDLSRLLVRHNGNETQSTILKQGGSDHLYFLVRLELPTRRQRHRTCGWIPQTPGTVPGRAAAAITSTCPTPFCTPGKQTSFSASPFEIDVMADCLQ